MNLFSTAKVKASEISQDLPANAAQVSNQPLLNHSGQLTDKKQKKSY